MAIADDISVAVNGDIRYTGTTANYTVIELHRFLQDLADDAVGSGDDLLDITSDTPSDRSTDNIITLNSPYNIDDTLAQHIYDGSIIQDDGDTIYDGIVVFAPQGTAMDIIQNGAVLSNFWTTGLNADAGQGISHRFMVKVRNSGSDIDGRRLLGQTRVFGFTYSEFPVNGTSRGNNVIALVSATDLNNQTAEGTVSGWTGITLTTEGYVGLDLDGNAVNEFYYSQWNTNQPTRTINDFYERMKWLTRENTSETLYGLNGELFRGITHEIDVDTPTGTFNAFEPVSWTGGSGQMLAINSTTAATKMWIQLLTGIAPTDGLTITGGTSSATVDVDTTVTTRTISLPFIGASTGSALIGAYGIGLEAADTTNSDIFFDLTNTQRVPPNNVTFTVGGLVSGEDRVLVGPESGGDLQQDQFGLQTALTTDNITSVQIDTTIPSDTPSSGTIRVVDDAGVHRRLEYSSYTGDTFTITTTDGNEDFSGDEASVSNDVYISYIDTLAGSSSESFTGVYLSDRALFIRVRDGDSTPIKTFETTGTLGSGGGSTTAIRTSDE
jgi:hypothetical protein